MQILILGLIIFFGIHLFPTFRTHRASMIQKLGDLTYKGIFAILSFIGFALILWGKSQAGFIEVWQPPQVLAIGTKILMLPAFIFLVAAYIPSNIKRKVRHPMLIGVKCWALGHLLINGDLASILLFGSFLAYAVIDVVRTNQQTVWNKPEPKSPILTGLVIVVGLVCYIGVALHHQQFFGVPIF